jgi:hypothetical protein
MAPERTGTKDGVLEPLAEQGAVGEPGQPVVQRVASRSLGAILQSDPSLLVEDVGGGDISQRLGRGKGAAVHRAGARPVEVEGAEAASAVAQGECEHRRQSVRGRGGPEHAEAAVGGQVGSRHGRRGGAGRQAGSLAEGGLQLLVAQRGGVGGGQEARRRAGSDQGDPAPVTGRMETIRTTR